MPNFVPIEPSIAKIRPLINFLKTAAVPILDFQKFELLTACNVRKVNIRHRAKIRDNRTIRCEDMAVFIFQDGALYHLGFLKL